MKLKDKVALITGSSRGIGRSIAILFAKEGAKIIVNYNNSEEEAMGVVKEIKDLGSEVIAIKCDVSKEDEVKNMIKKSIDKFGRIDILVNNAGIFFDVPFEERTVNQWKRTLEVNIIGTFLCTKYVVKVMLKQGYGNLINISSINAINNNSSDSIDYDTSKAGVINFTKSMAEEFAPHVRVNCIAPGWVDTDINKELPKDFVKEVIKKISLRRFGQPIEIANVALFLASEDSSYMTGSVVVVDGGYK